MKLVVLHLIVDAYFNEVLIRPFMCFIIFLITIMLLRGDNFLLNHPIYFCNLLFGLIFSQCASSVFKIKFLWG